MSEEDCEIIYKVVVVGDSGVGKTNILNRYLKNEFNFDSKATVGVEFGAKRFEIKNKKIKALLWDTAGQERFKSITSQYYKGAKGALLIYDITQKKTFDSIDSWITDLRNNGDNIHILLIGNKCDMQQERVVSFEEGEKKAKLYNIGFMETSAFLAINIDKAFSIMIEEIFEKLDNFGDIDKDEEYDFGEEKFVELNTMKKEKKGCC